MSSAPVTEPIPQERRRLSGLDQGVLWSNFAISLLGVVAGAGLIAYGAGTTRALVATALGSAIGGLMLAAAGALGAASGQPGMVVLRRALGTRGSFVPTALNVAQGLGWGTFELLVIAEAARQVVGAGPRWPYAVAAGLVGTSMAVLGPETVARRILKRIVTPLVAVAIGYLLLRLLLDGGGGVPPAVGGLGLMAAVDLVVANCASWQPLVPDYSRFSASPRSAALGVGLGFGVASAATFAVGILAATHGGIDSASAGVAVMLALPLGLVAAAVLVVDEADKGFANIYSTAVSLRNLAPHAPQAPLAIAVGALVTAGAIGVSLDRFFDFLFLLGAVFVPLFGAVYADRLRPPRPLATIAAWAAGFVLYEWLSPTTLLGLADHVAPPFDAALGATIPSFALAFLLRLVWPGRR